MKKSLVLIIPAAAILIFAGDTYALEITLSDNGSGSNSEVTVNNSANAEVHQTNNAQVSNQVNVQANTGSNQVSENIGDTIIETGEIKSEIGVSSSVNSSIINSCCPDTQNETKLTISGNGSRSDNFIGVSLELETNLAITQKADIENKEINNANTGGNEAKDNSGNVHIKTGDINIKNELRNKFINNADVNGKTMEDSLVAKILGNGSGSVNLIKAGLQNRTDVSIENLTLIKNILENTANTGDNLISGDTGSISITTGDINIDNLIVNKDINDSSVNTCCDDPNPPGNGGSETPAPSPAPPQPGGGGNGGGGGGSTGNGGGGSASSGGQVLAAAISAGGQILPATGSYWLYLMTLASVIMLMLGLYLRLHPGQDPGLKLAYA